MKNGFGNAKGYPKRSAPKRGPREPYTKRTQVRAYPSTRIQPYGELEKELEQEQGIEKMMARFSKLALEGNRQDIVQQMKRVRNMLYSSQLQNQECQEKLASKVVVLDIKIQTQKDKATRRNYSRKAKRIREVIANLEQRNIRIKEADALLRKDMERLAA